MTFKNNKNIIRTKKCNYKGQSISRRTLRKWNVQGLVVCMMASHIEGLAAELGNETIRELAIEVRKTSNGGKTEEFGVISDMFDTMISLQRWTDSQLLVALCWMIKTEADKLQRLYFEIDTKSAFPKYQQCVELRQYAEGCFLPRNIMDAVNEVIIYFKESCKL